MTRVVRVFPARRAIWLRAKAFTIVLVGAACHPRQTFVAESVPVRQASVDVPGSASIQADVYGTGGRGVVILAHGGRYSSRSSWAPEARKIASAGFHVLVLETHAAADLAAGKETPCLYNEVCLAKDVRAGVRYLEALGVNRIALIGGSMGGAVVAQASVEAGHARYLGVPAHAVE
jgi:pimeloyl-ACP methyl ester carboxylesterase